MASAVARILQPLAVQRPWLAYFVVVAFAVFVWAAVGLGPYSGMNTPPQFGDFEAQRHWMEITQHLSPSEWYFYEFDWWRLDYPPLTAYHSWICGIVGSKINALWFALDTSRGAEGAELKAFMRATVIASQLLVYVPAVYLWIKSQTSTPGAASSKSEGLKAGEASGEHVKARYVALSLLLLFPGLTIIDHGHFQYNSVMLGLTVASLTALVKQRLVLASALFVGALFFKQMALYYAPVIFFSMLGLCVGPAVQWELKFGRLLAVGSTVIVTSSVLLLPFRSLDQLGQILQRVFPVFRGLWEDKVANLWCTLNYTLVKLNSRFDSTQLQILALAATLAGILPSCIAAFVGKPHVWPWAFASCAWSFFLFSFQVHEKSVLLPLVPTLLTAVQARASPNVFAMGLWISNIAYFSMWPLLKREELQLQYFVLLALYNWLLTSRETFFPRSWLNRLAVTGSYAFFISLAIAERFELVPFAITGRYPDLFVVGNMTASFGCFVYFWLWQTWYMLTLTTLE